ncbi:SanA/YdcF family protein [Cronobacter malonaticus]|uniref:SanA/YdcF family protein n=1 Tax=Cronobacter malonaticus TaxID=413503 RepID=UPI002895E2ED|nr:ElyC/SanA/YdcF family protein [Cronobacter malonaticus]ELY5937994.1 YdcF family protein [Cronobacter malonaticus]ELY6203631.1 YdcF family protein [Cronobacter malonaticus]ELY6258123.1 YdcF family protein [Cronobacter malonaticus]MDT3561149.1 ElyC/SanA/YdcF family protein [Cronobacter malonaticus]
MKFSSRSKRGLTLAAVIILTGALVSVMAIIGADRAVTHAAAGRLYDTVENIPARKVGLVLGARPDNRFFNRRIEAAAALYHAGKVSWLLVSGDNSRADYDEPTAMAEALNRHGVPAAAIFCDYAGFSTLDSVVRAREVFQENRITIISQAFHNQRAIYLAQHYGIDAIGFNAEDPALRHTQYTLLRERFARVRAMLDARLLRREPHFLGPQVKIGPKDAPRGCNIYAATP